MQAAAKTKARAAAAEPDKESEAASAKDDGAGGLRGRVQALFGPDSRLRRQFMAWWEGYYLPDEQKAEEPKETVDDANARLEADAKALAAGGLPDTWSAARVKVSELIWSDGFSFPGGSEHVLKLVKPMGLTKEKTMLDLNSGLGGAARVIAKAFGTYVTGMDASQTLAKAGMAASEKAGLAKKAVIEWFDPLTVILPQRKYDAIFARLVFLPLEQKKRLMAQVEQALKPGGQLMFLEFALGSPDAKSPALEAWVKGEDHAPHPITIDAYAEELKALKMDVRVAEDMTKEFRALVLEGWARLAQALKPNSLAEDEAKGLTHEVELWSRRVAAFDSGDLRVARLYAIKKK
ncbi:MAG TPA: methyltransferase domain-containing protein [Alphaproteobacteria bacterium]|nr:methyltransferase domain-containing protein [Alphaproteobacteria bacterium]